MFRLDNPQDYCFLGIPTSVSKILIEAFPLDTDLIQALMEDDRPFVGQILEIYATCDFSDDVSLDLEQWQAIKQWGDYCRVQWGG